MHIISQPQFSLEKQWAYIRSCRRCVIDLYYNPPEHQGLDIKEKIFIKRTTGPIYNNPAIIEKVQQLYVDGRKNELLKIDWTEFFLYVFRFRDLPDSPKYYPWGANCEYRGHTKYVKDIEHSEKEPDPKEDWREASGVYRDKAKSGGRGSNCHQNSAKTYWKTKAARQHRRWARKKIKSENYDAFWGEEYKEFADPRKWD